MTAETELKTARNLLAQVSAVLAERLSWTDQKATPTETRLLDESAAFLKGANNGRD
jgi:hypothetical protein